MILVIERGTTGTHCAENWLWKRMWTCSKTDYENEEILQDSPVEEPLEGKKSYLLWLSFLIFLKDTEKITNIFLRRL